MLIHGSLQEIDILAIGVHPDDVELSCGGTLLAQKEQGYSFGILDLTKGEMGTRGDEETRLKESLAASKILGAEFRANVGLRDAYFQHNSITAEKLIPYLRAAKPKIVLANALRDRHPDHGRAAKLVQLACFLSGLSKIETQSPDGTSAEAQERHRPNQCLHYAQDYALEPDLVVNIEGYLDQKMKAILAYKSQFYDPESSAPSTPISGKDFLQFVKDRAAVSGRFTGMKYGESFNFNSAIGLNNIMHLR